VGLPRIIITAMFMIITITVTVITTMVIAAMRMTIMS